MYTRQRWLKFILAVFVIFSVVLFGAIPHEAVSATPLWQEISAKSLPQTQRQIIPQRYRTFAVQFQQLQTLLAQAPHERAVAAHDSLITLELPLPDGRFEHFRVVESPIMTDDAAARYPTIKTYLVQGVESPATSGRLDVTPAGFHAMLLLADTTVFIDPYQVGDTQHVISYNADDYVPDIAEVRDRFANEQVIGSDQPAQPSAQRPEIASGSVLRTYRLALGATGEYTQFHGGTKAAAFAAMTTSINRVNAVYEREVAVRLILINNDAIIYTDPATDGYTNSSGSTMLYENQAKLNSIIGSANYDIGHVFSTGGGGVASLGCVCKNSQKAMGVTGLSNPVGDPFDIDYVAHEIGHQFGGNHTFNSTEDYCGGGNREAPAAYEPGSGSTIMAYAGICGSENLQPHSDPYFHTKSFDEIRTFINGGGDVCAAKANTGNSAPVVNAGAAYTIPSRTPFTLTGSASDPNGDSLVYGWEQFDLGSASSNGSLSVDDGSRPLFRSFNPVASPARTFPQLSDIVANTSTIGEVLPTTSRTMHFRLTARDNRAGGGGVDYASTQVTSVDTSEPFLVTAPNSAITWPGASNQTITWNVANTNLAPINCATVNILLSTDGGLSFPTTLVNSTANNGSVAITAPSVIDTTQARVKIQCSTNIFFDISNTDFTIVPIENLEHVYLPFVQR